MEQVIDITSLNLGENPTIDNIENVLKNYPGAKFNFDAFFMENVENNNLAVVEYAVKYVISSNQVIDCAINSSRTLEMHKLLLNAKIVEIYFLLKNKSKEIDSRKFMDFCKLRVDADTCQNDNNLESDKWNRDYFESHYSTSQTPNEYLNNVLMLLINNCLIPGKLVTLQPHLNKPNVSMYQYICGMSEILFNYLIILKEYMLDIDIKLVDKMKWIFDNSDNPIEKKLNIYMQNHPEINYDDKDDSNLPEKKVTLTSEQYIDILKMTYDFTKLLKEINENYSLESILDMILEVDHTLKNEQELINSLKYLILLDFILNTVFADYLID